MPLHKVVGVSECHPAKHQQARFEAIPERLSRLARAAGREDAGLQEPSGCRTRAGGEDVDQGGDAAAADEGEEHVVIEGSAHLVVEEVCAPIEDLDFAGGGRAVEKGNTRERVKMSVDT